MQKLRALFTLWSRSGCCKTGIGLQTIEHVLGARDDGDSRNGASARALRAMAYLQAATGL